MCEVGGREEWCEPDIPLSAHGAGEGERDRGYQTVQLYRVSVSHETGGGEPRAPTLDTPVGDSAAALSDRGVAWIPLPSSALTAPSQPKGEVSRRQSVSSLATDSPWSSWLEWSSGKLSRLDRSHSRTEELV